MNAYDFLLSLDRLDGRLIDETMDCLYPKERHGGRCLSPRCSRRSSQPRHSRRISLASGKR